MLKKLRSKSSSLGGQSSQTIHPVGCDVVYEGLSPISADVVFVHGLRGHRNRTWTKDNVFWPQDLLPKDLPGVRVMSFGYDANITNFLQPTSTNNIHYHAKALIDGMLLHRRNETERPVIFVCHSLGGIICKDALDYSKQNIGFQTSLAQIVSACKGIIFLGTPHRGSAAASLAVYAARIAKAAFLDTNETTPKALTFDSEVLERISEAFARLLAARNFGVHSYFEELQTPGIGTVVDRNSAVIGDAFEKKSTIYANHQDMCRFSDSKCNGYQKILASIQEFIIVAASGRSMAQDTGKDDAPSIHTNTPKTQSSPINQMNNDKVVKQSQGFEQRHASSVTKSDRLYGRLPDPEPTREPSVTPEAKISTAPRRLRARLREKDGSHMLSVFFEDRCLNIQFHRTVRVPDDGKTYDLPANLGTFPLFNVADFEENLSTDTVEKGGFFLPMYKREALWISFHEEGKWRRTSKKIPFAIRIYTGGINAISGEAMRPNMATFLKAMNGVRPKQDYLVFPDQQWIDGTAVSPGVVRQFVSTSYGSGFSIEKQITGLETVGGIQIEIIPASAGMRIMVIAKRQFYVYMRPDDTVALLQKTIADRENISALDCILKSASKSLQRDRTLSYYNIKEGSVIHCHCKSSPDQTLSDLNVQKESTLHLVLRLRGGGHNGSPIDQEKIQMMAIATGGKIKQAIIPDMHPEDIWKPESSAFFNIQLVNTTRFKEITALSAPPTPVTFQTYLQTGLPFYKLFDEPESTISGDFSAVKPLAEVGDTSYGDTDELNIEDDWEPPARQECAICNGVNNWPLLIGCEPCNHKVCPTCFNKIVAEPIKLCPVARCGKMIVKAVDLHKHYPMGEQATCHDTIRPSEVMPLRLAERDLPQRFMSINAVAR